MKAATLFQRLWSTKLLVTETCISQVYSWCWAPNTDSMPHLTGKLPTWSIHLDFIQRVLVFILANIKVQVDSLGDVHTVISPRYSSKMLDIFFVGWSWIHSSFGLCVCVCVSFFFFFFFDCYRDWLLWICQCIRMRLYLTSKPSRFVRANQIPHLVGMCDTTVKALLTEASDFVINSVSLKLCTIEAIILPIYGW